jgi:hypothetical protein
MLAYSPRHKFVTGATLLQLVWTTSTRGFMKLHVNTILDILNIVDIPRVRTSTYGKNSFKYAAAVLWNDLPDDFRKISNFNQFKNILKSWNGNICKCSACADF